METKRGAGAREVQAEQMQLTAREQEVLARVARGTAGVVVGLLLTLAGCGSSTSSRELGRGHEELKAGVQTLDLSARVHSSGTNGLAHLPKIEITVPAGWSNFDGWAMHKGTKPDSVFVTFWDVSRVYSVPCRWQYKPMVDPGRGVDGLAAVLAKQPLRQATAPAEVELGGLRGKYLEWSVPRGIDFADCDEGVFESWTARGWSSDRYQQEPGQVDRIWILDADGERLVVDASYLPRATAIERAELERVVASIRFLD
jgi:hypothetical protein